MRQTFLEFIERTDEKLIVYNGGKSYGQIVFLAGGAASGKDYAIKHFMEGNKFKVRDVDAYKDLFLKLAKIKEQYKELRNLETRNPEDVSYLHQWIKNKGIEEKTFDLLFQDAKSDRLPNVIFNVTLKDYGEFSVLPFLLSLGYIPKNIHLTWVLTEFEESISNNQGRSRVVGTNIHLKTHVGAAKTMTKIIQNGPPENLDGEIRVILNNKRNTTMWVEPKRASFVPKYLDPTIHEKPPTRVEDFSYLKIKNTGKPMAPPKTIMDKLLNWIKDNSPHSA